MHTHNKSSWHGTKNDCTVTGELQYGTKNERTITTQLQYSRNNMVTLNNASDYRTYELYRTFG